jgi:SAM-dependent methyltransferase
MDRDVYAPEHIEQWSDDKPFLHASGIWGRKRLVDLMAHTLKPDSVVADLGCGGGYLSKLLSEFVPRGRVIGSDYKKEFVDLAKKNYSDVSNLSFEVLDVKDVFPYKTESIDYFVSFMVLQNLHSNYIDAMFGEVSRCLTTQGSFFSLTLHPDIWMSDWNLEFIQYDKLKISEWQRTREEDLRMEGFVLNRTQGVKELYMYTHSMGRFSELLEKHGLVIDIDLPIYIDKETSDKYFGVNEDRVYPSVPVFWIFSVKKK